MAHCSQTMMNLTFKIKISLFPLWVICEQRLIRSSLNAPWMDFFLLKLFFNYLRKQIYMLLKERDGA